MMLFFDDLSRFDLYTYEFVNKNNIAKIDSFVIECQIFDVNNQSCSAR